MLSFCTGKNKAVIESYHTQEKANQRGIQYIKHLSRRTRRSKKKKMASPKSGATASYSGFPEHPTEEYHIPSFTRTFLKKKVASLTCDTAVVQQFPGMFRGTYLARPPSSGMYKKNWLRL